MNIKKTLAISALVLTAYPLFAATSQVACTMEAKLCPDGTYVGRQGPNCEFAACPGDTSRATSTPKVTGNATSSARSNATSTIKGNPHSTSTVSTTTPYVPNASPTGVEHRSTVANYVQSIVHTIGGWFLRLFGR